MTQTRKQAILTLIIWGSISAGFLALFFTGGGPETYKEDKLRFVLTAIIFAVGFICHPLMLYLTRNNEPDGGISKDERDEWISHKADRVTLVVILMFIFSTCIGLWLFYEDSNSVPVGWMWFLAYSSAFLAYLVNAATTLLYDTGVIDSA